MTCCQKDSPSSLSLPNDMTGGRRAQNAMLPNNKLLDSICCANFRDQLYDLGIPVSSVTSNNQGAALRTFWDGKKDRGDEGFAVVRVFEDHDLFSKPRAVKVYQLCVGLAGWDDR